MWEEERAKGTKGKGRRDAMAIKGSSRWRVMEWARGGERKGGQCTCQNCSKKEVTVLGCKA